MTPYQIQGPARICSITGRELKPGERFYSALLDEAGQLLRKDFASDAWKEPPTGSIAFWTGKIPTSDRPVKPIINEELLLDCFEHLTETQDPKQQNFRYILALLLMRKKRLRFEDLRKHEDGEYLHLRDLKNNEKYEILDPRLSEQEMEAVQDEVFRVLGWN